MKKIKFLFIALVIIIATSSVATTIIAAENDNNDTQKETTKTLTEEEIKQQKQEILVSIDGYLNEIESRIFVIDQEIENTKKQDEFEYYPAIRLNIDTPMFGMSAIVENKLKIKKDVSTTDIANKYSIRNLVKDRKIKLPDNYLAGIVVSTKDVAIDENMTLSQLKLTLVKCIQYKSQVNSVEEFVDTQINKTFKDYIAQEKKNNIKDVKDRTEKVKKTIEEISDKIYQMSFVGVNINDYMNKYNELSNQLYDISQKAKDTLMNKEDLTQLMKNSLSNESNVLDLKTAVDDAYEDAITDMDYLKVLNNYKSTYTEKHKKIKNYIDNSTTEEKDENTKENDNEENKDEEKNKEDTDYSKINIVRNYSITLENTDEYFEKILDDLENKIKNYTETQAKTSEETEKKEEKSESEIEVEKAQKFNDNKTKMDELYNKYKEALNRENKFYTNNINMLLNDSNSKMTSIIGQIDSDIVIDNEIFNYTKYVYIDLPNNLSNYLEKNNSYSMLELNNLNSSLYNEISNLVKTNMNIKKMYDKMTEDLLKS